MNIPNIITILRILLVPLVVWLMISREFGYAFLVFVLAGVSDAIDGYLARKLNAQSELGAYLDPLADKSLLVSIFLTLGSMTIIPVWLVIIVVTRDILIVGAVMLAWVLGRPVAMKPLWISKVNTVAQIGFAGVALLTLSSKLIPDTILSPAAAFVAALTLASGALYMVQWLRHMALANNGKPRQ